MKRADLIATSEVWKFPPFSELTKFFGDAICPSCGHVLNLIAVRCSSRPARTGVMPHHHAFKQGRVVVCRASGQVPSRMFRRWRLQTKGGLDAMLWRG